MALGRFLRGFLASPAAIYVRSDQCTSVHSKTGSITYGNNLSSDERERSLRHDCPPTEETSLGAPDAMELDEGTWVLPVAETDTIMVGTTSEVEHDTQNNEASNRDDLDGPARVMSICITPMRPLHLREDEFGFPICASTQHVDGNNDHKTHGDPYCIVHCMGKS